MASFGATPDPNEGSISVLDLGTPQQKENSSATFTPSNNAQLDIPRLDVTKSGGSGGGLSARRPSHQIGLGGSSAKDDSVHRPTSVREFGSLSARSQGSVSSHHSHKSQSLVHSQSSGMYERSSHRGRSHASDSDSDSDSDSVMSRSDDQPAIGGLDPDRTRNKACCKLCTKSSRRQIALESSSFFILSGDNKLRVFLYNLIHTKAFEAVVITLILANSVLLALDTPVPDGEERPQYQETADYFFVAAFSLEMLFKMVALGVAGHPGAYLRSSWNVLDFIIVVLSYLSLIEGFGKYTALRTLRVLRPLRSMNAVPQLKAIVVGLLHSLRGLANVMLLGGFIFGIFGILAVQLWSGNFRMRCREIETGVVDEERFCRNDTLSLGTLIGRPCDDGFECINYGNPNFGITSFDNVGYAFLVMIQCITLEGWALIMYSTMDHSGWYTALYFIMLIVIGSYFVLNLALAVIDFEFRDAKNKMMRDEEQRKLEEEQVTNAQAQKNVMAFRGSISHARQSVSYINAGLQPPEPLAVPKKREFYNRRTMLVDLIDFADGEEDRKLRKEAAKAEEQEMETKPVRRSVKFEEEAEPSCLFRAYMWTRYFCFWLNEGSPKLQLIKFDDEEEEMERNRSGKNSRRRGSAVAEATSIDIPTTWFTRFIVLIIFANTVVLAAEHHGQSEDQAFISEILNSIFTVLFGVEMLLKMIGLTPQGYVSDSFNVFDGIITIVSLVEFGLGGGGTISALRAFRLLRVFRLLKNFPSLRAVVGVCLEAIKETGYLNIIILLYLFIMALVGMQLFGLRLPPYSDDNELRSTFNDFLWSFYSVFQILTRDSWPDIMWLAMDSTHHTAAIYFVFCVFAGDFMILNLFLAILISSFDSVGGEGMEEDDEEEPQLLEDGLTKETAKVTLVSKPVGQFLGSDQHSGSISGALFLGSPATPASPTNAATGPKPVLAMGASVSSVNEATPDVESTRMRATGTEWDTFMHGNDVKICPHCGDPIIEPFDPLGKNIKKITPQALHDRMCEKIQLRKVREKAIRDMLLDYGFDSEDSDQENDEGGDDESQFSGMVDASVNKDASHEDNGVGIRFMGFRAFAPSPEAGERGGSPFRKLLARHPKPTPRLVEEAFGRAWEVSLLLGERLENYLYMSEWASFRRLLKDELAVLEMRIGEEQVGRALIAYTRANVPRHMGTNGGESLFLFGPKNPFRVFLTLIVTNPWFEKIILLCILASSVLMAIDNPRTPNKALDDASNAFTVIFVVEALMKIIAFNFFFHPTAYLKDSWNVLDFFIVFISVLSWILEASAVDFSLNFIKVLRTFRALRPLRVVNRNRGLKMVVSTLLQSLKFIANVALITVLVYLVFAIMGVQFFKGGMYRCTDECVTLKVDCTNYYIPGECPWVTNISAFSDQLWVNGTIYPNVTMLNNGSAIDKNTNSIVNVGAEILKREWYNEDFNFDNTYESFLTLFHAATLDDWGTTMFAAIDIVSDEHVPRKDNVQYRGLFFVVFIIVGSFFLLNMFVGVIIFKFNMVKEELDGSYMLTQEQKLWVETQRMMLNFRPERKLNPGKRKWEQTAFQICMDPRFELGTGVAILLNIIFIGMEHHNQTDDFTLAMYIANVIFVAVFFFEAALKIVAFGWDYFMNSWNRFDFFIVVVSIVDLGLDGNIPINVGLLRVLRVFRIMRILSLVKKAKDVRILLETLWYSLPSLANIGAFLILIFFIYAVLGVQLFALVKRRGGLTHYTNFEHFGTAFLFLIQTATLDNWGVVMISLMDTSDCGGTDPNTGKELDDCGTPVAPLYFATFIVMAGFVMVNLFVAIILDNFNTTMTLDKSVLKMSDLKKFAEAWARFDEKATMLVDTKRFPSLLASLKPPLGISRQTDRIALLQQAERFAIPEHGGVIHFVETLIPLARQVLGVEFSETDIRDHEDNWKLQFPDLNNLRVLRYRQRRVTVDQYFAATFIASAQRRRNGIRTMDRLRKERRKEIKRWYDEHGVPEKQREALMKMDRQARERMEQRMVNEALMEEFAQRRRTEVELGELEGGLLDPQQMSMSRSPSKYSNGMERSKSLRRKSAMMESANSNPLGSQSPGSEFVTPPANAFAPRRPSVMHRESLDRDEKSLRRNFGSLLK